jgi:hypothetical protein
VVIVACAALAGCTPPTPQPDTFTPTSISGRAIVGTYLNAIPPPHWYPYPAYFKVEWLRCDDNSGDVCVVAAKTLDSYLITDADLGKYLIARVTGYNASGIGGSSRSGAIGPVVAAP